jgi:hypothetical protein
MSTATMSAVNLGNRSLVLGNSRALLFVTVDALLSRTLPGTEGDCPAISYAIISSRVLVTGYNYRWTQ